jgi:preprotein translocase subunit SecG
MLDLISIVVLVQSGKGGGLGAGFGGGGANTLFGSSGGGNFFTKMTMCLAAGFMVTSLGLTVVKSHGLKTSIFDQGSSRSAPANPVGAGQGTPVAPGTPAGPGSLAAPIAPAAPGTPPIAPKAPSVPAPAPTHR